MRILPLSPRAGRAPLKVAFPIVAQWHQAYHSLPIAAALSRRDGYQVHVAVTTASMRPLAQEMLQRLGAADVRLHHMWPDHLTASGASPPKVLMLAGIAPRLAGFDAIVVPERTSLILKRMGVSRPRFVHTDHGAGDRAVGYEPRIRRFDLVLLAGEKQRDRMQRAGLIAPDRHAIVGYPKFEAVAACRPAGGPLFDAPRPTVVYNPHFKPGMSSWADFGADVLAQFAAQRRYNLIFAPHVRLAAELGLRLERAVARYRDLPNLHLDLGGPRCCDMTYTDLADVYLGDVSSQVYEFLRRPRPCVFLNVGGADRAGDENYAHWGFGPVVGAVQGLIPAIDRARDSHPTYLGAQVTGFARTFDLAERPCSERAADAIEVLLGREPPMQDHRRRDTRIAA